jgi:hypothetical protein
MDCIRTLVVLATTLTPLCWSCSDGGAQAEEPLVAPPPRCAELEQKMLECAREATGLEQLPASVAAGVEQAAGLNCRRMRSASRDPGLPARVVATCATEACPDFPACVAREAGPDVLVAAREPARGGPPDFGALVGGAATEGATESDPTSKSVEERCEPFVRKLLTCAEQPGGALEQLEADGAARAFLEACGYLTELPEATLDAAFAACADAACDGYGDCVAAALAAADTTD